MPVSKSEGSRLPVLIVICAPVAGETGEEPPSHLPIDGWREWGRVRDVVEKAKDPRTGHGAPLKLVRLLPPTLANLRERLHAGQTRPAYPMVHLIGYVSPEDGLLRMEQENGREAKVTPKALAAAFRDAGVQIALLNICAGRDYAQALIQAGAVRTVVTTCGAISDPEATLLAREIYLRLAFGDSIGDAYPYAKDSLIEAYRQGNLPPIEEQQDWEDERARVQYGRHRAVNIILLGDRELRLPLPPPDEATTEPAFDLSEPPHNLPHPDNIFVGRGMELLQVSDWMDEHRFRAIALTGIGGIGKSSLALATALRNSWRFQGVMYLTAKDAGGPRMLTLDDVCCQVEAVLGLGSRLSSLPTPEARRQRTAEVLNARPYLLVLDNLEVLTPPQTAELADFLNLIDSRSGTRALLTLRPGYCPPLVDQMKSNLYPLPVESLDPPDAVALLGELLRLPVERDAAAAARAAWDKVPSRPAAPSDRMRVEALASRCDVPLAKVGALDDLAAAAHRHPLLLRFAAADLKQPENTWDAVLRRLWGLRGEDLQEKVEDMIGTMCDDLAQPQQKPEALTLLQALLLFAGGATRNALRFVWYGEQVEEDSDEAEAFDDICRAARRASLLDVRADRADLHPLVRQYLDRRRPPDPEQRTQWTQAHAAYFLDYARRLWRNHDALERERHNLFAVMDWTEEAGELRSLVALACQLSGFLWVRGFWREGRERMTRGIAAAQRLRDYQSQALLLHELGVLCWEQGDYAEAGRCYDQSLGLKEALSDKRGKAATLHQLGLLCWVQGDKAAACHYHEQSLALFEALDDKEGKAAALHELGALCREQGHYPQAQHYYEQSLTLQEELEEHFRKARTLAELGILYREQGHYEQARRYCEQSLTLQERLSDNRGKARTLAELGILYREQGHYEQARRYCEQSLTLQERLGDKLGKVITLHALAMLEQVQGQIDMAEELHQNGLRLAGELDNLYWKAYSLYGLGQCAQTRQQREKARQWFAETLEIAKRLSIAKLIVEVQTALEQL